MIPDTVEIKFLTNNCNNKMIPTLLPYSNNGLGHDPNLTNFFMKSMRATIWQIFPIINESVLT